MKTNYLLAILALLVLSTNCSRPYNSSPYTFTFDNTYGHLPSYSIGYIDDGYTVMVNLTTTAGGLDAVGLKVELWATVTEPQAIPCPALISDSYTATKLNAVFTCAVTASNTYILTITTTDYPTEDGGGNSKALYYYQLTAISYLTAAGGPTNNSAVIKTLVKATDTLRNKVVKLVYLNQSSVNISLYPSASFNPAKVFLIPILTPPTVTGSAYDFTSQSYIQLTESQSNDVKRDRKFFTATQTLLGYYQLVVYYPDKANYIELIYPSETYNCPQSASFPDLRGNFQPCTGSSSGSGTDRLSSNVVVPGYPCINFNNIINKCTVCFTGYILYDSGICLFNTSCPSRQYYHFGLCYPVDVNCDAFDAFGGACLNCTDPLRYVVNGQCIVNPALVVNCTSKQYKLNNKCYDVSALCKAFDTATGGCTSCIEGYQLSVANAACFPKKVVCPANQYISNGVCADIPATCVSFNFTTLKCDSCSFGYYVNNGACEKIFCAVGKVPTKYGIFCSDVSPLCNKAGQYDPLTGDCLKCNDDGYTLIDDGYTLINGACVQNVNPLSGCAARQALGYGACVNPQTNCQAYNLLSLNCQQCVTGWFKDSNGVCTLQNNNQNCKGDQVSIQGYCVQKPANCLIVDNLGLCTSCNGTQFQLQNGQCVRKVTCSSGQYLSVSGVCINVPAGCASGTFNPSNGICLTCNNGSAAVNGLCCASNQVAYGEQCIDSRSYGNIVSSAQSSQVPTCLAWHPTLGHCLECNSDFEPDPTVPGGCY